MGAPVMTQRTAAALRYFSEGNNCAQSVLMAYGDLAGLDADRSALLAAGLGGGMGRLRETCGAFSAAVMLAGALDGRDGAAAHSRVSVYRRVQRMHDAFVASCGSICCGTLLGRTREEPQPESRTPAYYASRPCARIILAACRVLEDELALSRSEHRL